MNLTPEKLVRDAKTISSLPTVFQKLNSAVNDPRASNRDIANIISGDSGLAARLLRVANSAFYGFPSKIDTVTRAVTVLGTRQLRDLALATSVLQMFEGMSDDIVSMESFWMHSIACAVAARILAGYRREPNVERFFVAGLVHDIGRLVILMQYPEQEREVIMAARERGELLHKLEKEQFGFDHSAVGSLLLKSWKIPEHTVTAIAYQHRPSLASDSPDATIVHVADIIATAAQLGNSGERLVPSLDEKAWENLDMSESIIPPLMAQLETQFEDALKLILP